jgi:hypothetical protein
MAKDTQQISCRDVVIESADLVLADRCGSVEALRRQYEAKIAAGSSG